MTAKRSHPRIPILLRLEPEELASIDEVREGLPRTTWIRMACQIMVNRERERPRWIREIDATPGSFDWHVFQSLTDGA